MPKSSITLQFAGRSLEVPFWHVLLSMTLMKTIVMVIGVGAVLLCSSVFLRHRLLVYFFNCLRIILKKNLLDLFFVERVLIHDD